VRRSRRVVAGLSCLVAAPLLLGCSEVEPESREVYEPATVHEVAGSEAADVVLTPRGAEEVGLRLATSRRAGTYTAAPYAALVYDGDGVPWVYVSRAPLAFRRVRVAVARVDGGQVLIASGLEPGARVVTVGAAELYGTELGIAGKH